MKNSLIKLIVTLWLLPVSLIFVHAQVGINENNANPDASAMLDVSSTDKGLLIPRMNSANREDITLKQRDTKAMTDEYPKKNTTNLTTADLRWLRLVEEKILAQIGNGHFKLRDLAYDLHISMRRFQQKIKKLTGQTPKGYQRHIKLQTAKKILKSGQIQTVSELSYRLGFEDQHYFSVLYKKQFGITPREELSR